MRYILNIQYFGGRGASAGGRTRQPGGGGNVTIINSTSLVSRRNEDGGKERKIVDDVLETAQWYKDKYGGEAYDLQVAKLSDKDDDTLAFCDMASGVTMNQKYWNDDVMNQVFDIDVKNGNHPTRGKKTALQATMAHEMGHVMNHRLAEFQKVDYNKVANDIVEDSRKLIKTTRGVVQMAYKISNYASKNTKETIAEAYADYYCNGKKAKKESRAIVYTMAKKLSGYSNSGVSKPNVNDYFTSKEYNEIEKRDK